MKKPVGRGWNRRPPGNKKTYDEIERLDFALLDSLRAFDGSGEREVLSEFKTERECE
jgi:hypothetical protein